MHDYEKTAKIEPELEKRKYWKLAASLFLDSMGMATYLLVGFGELADLIWAPVSGAACFLMYRGRLGFFGGLGATCEEILPLTDIIPSLTLVWFIRYGNGAFYNR